MSIKYDGKFLTVNSVVYDGREYEFVNRTPAVVILAHPNKDDVILVQQMRPTINEIIWELPAGKIDPGEHPDAAGARELAEETGFRSGATRSLFSCYMSPGYSTERMYFIQCANLTPGETNFDEGESIVTMIVSLEKALEMIDNGEIVDAKSMLALNWLARQ